MKDNPCRDDIFYNRLSSFLFKKGQLKVRQISTIKPHVFYIETIDDDSLLLKAHRQEKSVIQQWRFFDEIHLNESHTIAFEKFPNNHRMIKSRGFTWTIAPYISGKRITYRSSEERKQVVSVLKKFHKRATGIKIKPIIKKPMITERWYKRLLTFKKTEYIFMENGFENLYMDIVQSTEIYLRQLSRFPWSLYEDKAIETGTWIHGDVASHNFIKNRQVYLIDFDLLTCNPQIYDFIQLSQRFLPYINWDLECLLSYEMVSSLDIRKWLFGILIPSDIIREWIYVISHKSKQTINRYLKQLDINWNKRKRFSQQVVSMLKSM